MPVRYDSPAYNMNHTRRGIALIFNHESFSETHEEVRLLGKREGTHVDCNSLRERLTALDFHVQIHDNLPTQELFQVVRQAANADHSDCDCILVAFLTHGDRLGVLYSYDSPYLFTEVWSEFAADKCHTLAWKPKIFIIQACQGGNLTKGVELEKKYDADCDESNDNCYWIPNDADFLLIYATPPGFSSWRNPVSGSWFIESFCAELKENGTKMELLKLMTRVLRRVALDYEITDRPDGDPKLGAKQIPWITSMLIRNVFFTPKIADSISQ